MLRPHHRRATPRGLPFAASVLFVLLFGWTVAHHGGTEANVIREGAAHAPAQDLTLEGAHSAVHSASTSRSFRLDITMIATLLSLCVVLAGAVSVAHRRPVTDDDPVKRIAASPPGSRAPPIVLV